MREVLFVIDLELVAERARNLDAIWHQPAADTAAALARKHAELDLGFKLLREALMSRELIHNRDNEYEPAVSALLEAAERIEVCQDQPLEWTEGLHAAAARVRALKEGNKEQ